MNHHYGLGPSATVELIQVHNKTKHHHHHHHMSRIIAGDEELNRSIIHLTERQTQLKRAHDPIHINLAVVQQILVKYARKHSVTHISPLVVIQLAYAVQNHLKNILSSISQEARLRLENEEKKRKKLVSMYPNDTFDDLTIRNTNFELTRVLNLITNEHNQWRDKRAHLEKKRRMTVLKELRRYHSEDEYSSEAPDESEESDIPPDLLQSETNQPDLALDQLDNGQEQDLYLDPINASPGQMSELEQKVKKPSQEPESPISITSQQNPLNSPQLVPDNILSGKYAPSDYAQKFEKVLFPKLDGSYQSLSKPLLIRLYTMSKQWCETPNPVTPPSWFQPVLERLLFLLDQIVIKYQKSHANKQKAQSISKFSLLTLSDSRITSSAQKSNTIPKSTLFPAPSALRGYPGLFDTEISRNLKSNKIKLARVYINEKNPDSTTIDQTTEISKKQEKFREYCNKFHSQGILLDDIIVVLENMPIYARSHFLDKIILTRNLQKTRFRTQNQSQSQNQNSK